MLLSNIEDLTHWLLEKLPNICKADPQKLLQYILALIKKAKSENDLFTICNEALNVFLREKTNSFVDDLMCHMKDKKCLTSELDAKAENIDILPAFSNSEETNDNKLEVSKVTEKKRIDDSDGECWKNRSPNMHAKIKRNRGQSRNRSHESRKRRRYDRHEDDYSNKRRHSSRNKSHRSRHSRDRKSYPKREEKVYNDYIIEKKRFPIKTSCSDFVEKGVCIKGDACEFDHGTEIVRSDCIYSAAGNMNQNVLAQNWKAPISTSQNWMQSYGPTIDDNAASVQPIITLQSLNTNNNNTNLSNSSYDYRKKRKKSGVYDPSHPEIDGVNNANMNTNDSNAPVYVPSEVNVLNSNTANNNNSDNESLWWRECNNDKEKNNNINNTTQWNNDNSNQYQQKRYNNNHNNNANNSHYNNNRNNYNNCNNNNLRRPLNNNGKCLLLTHIPIECNDEVRLQQHFQQFGVVTDVVVGYQGDSHNTLIEFATHEQAKSAFRSPAPILDNRFIRTSLYNRPNEGAMNNITLSNDFQTNSIVKTEMAVKRKVVDVEEMNHQDENLGVVNNKWNRNRLLSTGSNVSFTELTSEANNVTPVKKYEPVMSKNRWPNPNELKIDRRPATENKAIVKPIEEMKTRFLEAKQEKVKNTSQDEEDDINVRIGRLEQSVECSKKRLRNLIAEQKKPDCDQELIRLQMIESYKYFKELRSMLEDLKKKNNINEAPLTEEEKIKQLIAKTQSHLMTLETDSDEYKKQLKSITELKRRLVNLNSGAIKVHKVPRIPKRVEMKLDNRPKVLYLSGFNKNTNIDHIRRLFLNYQVDNIETSDSDLVFFGVDFRTRKEADRAIKDFAKYFVEKNISPSFNKPEVLCDPLGFNSRASSIIEQHQRGTPRLRDDCPSSDDEYDSSIKMH